MPWNERNIGLLTGLLLLMAGAGQAIAGAHDGGVGSCSYCHLMHENEPGGPGGGPNPGNPMVIGGNPSDLCLSCHALDVGGVMGDNPLIVPAETGGGNFVFLLEDNLNDGADGMTNPIPGDAAGHNINAPSYGLATDPTQVVSPGGTYPSSRMRCTSCHDPHGNQNFRFLKGPAQREPREPPMSYPPPSAVGLDLLLGMPESNSNHTAYQSGMSQWCANCHFDYFTSKHMGGVGFEHATDLAMSASVLTTYNQYNGTADPLGGNASSAYLAEVPFEDLSNTTSSTAGPGAASRLMCLSCHRAHASSAPHSGRWDFNVTMLGDDGAVSGSYPLPNPYTDPTQGPLCQKCHGAPPVASPLGASLMDGP